MTVLNESFADTIAPDGAFDGVVGNVPFARVSLYDAKHNRGRHRIHNHFLIKSVALTRPGGVVALITSRHTLDAESSAARSELFEMADLLGAVRLPNKAFARSARHRRGHRHPRAAPPHGWRGTPRSVMADRTET